MPTPIDHIELAEWSDPRPVATGATGHREGKKLAFRLTLTPHAGGVYPIKNRHYHARFRDVGSNTDITWNVLCTYIPTDTTEPFDFEDFMSGRENEGEQEIEREIEGEIEKEIERDLEE